MPPALSLTTARPHRACILVVTVSTELSSCLQNLKHWLFGPLQKKITALALSSGPARRPLPPPQQRGRPEAKQWPEVPHWDQSLWFLSLRHSLHRKKRCVLFSFKIIVISSVLRYTGQMGTPHAGSAHRYSKFSQFKLPLESYCDVWNLGVFMYQKVPQKANSS